MNELDLLSSIRPIWLHRVLQSLARGSVLRDDLRQQLERYFSLLEQAVKTGDPAWLDSILSVWAASLTQSDLENGAINITQFVKELMLQTFSICRDALNESQALELMDALTPCFAYSFEKAAQYEMQARVSYVSNQLAQVQQTLEKLDYTKSAFISVAAHELKTPLTLVDGYGAMLRDQMEAANPSAPEIQLLDGIQTGTRRLRAIIDDMVDVSMLDNNLFTLTFQPVWINRLFKVLETELTPSLDERCLKLSINQFPGSGELTFGDPERLLQVFRNLLTNAIKYTPNGGTIQVDGRKLPGFIEITVEDTGIGIASEDQPVIFDKFSRIGNTALHSSGKTKFKGGGPGLGLHIAKGIIEGHGGAIWVESPGYDEQACPGSTFHILLPLRSEPPDGKMAKLFEPLAQRKS